MKLTILLIILACFKVSASVYGQTITLNERNAPLSKVFKQIEQQSGYSFFYKNELLKQSTPVTIHIEEGTLSEALDRCFNNQPLTYDIVDNTIIVKAKEKSILQKLQRILSAPLNINIKGRVTDTAGHPLPGAVIKVKGTNKAVMANDNGDFEITGVDANAVLIVTYIGYITAEVPVNEVENAQVKVILRQDVNRLESVNIVSTGYQKIPQERATGSFVQVDNTLVNRRVSTDIVSRLEGVVPGLVFNRNNLTGGISIRGHSTIFANDQPLVVVDNFPYDGDITNINPNDVENITVLKDAAAASIWGVRSGNGVIVITTKKGRQNQNLKVDFNANVTVGNKPDLYYNPNFITSKDFISIEEDLFKKGYYDDKLSSGFAVVSPVVALLDQVRTGAVDSLSAYGQINAFKNADIRRDLQKYFYQKSINQQYSLSLRGGASKSDYYFSMGYDANRTNMVGNVNNRLTLNSTYNFYPLKNLQLSAGLFYTQATAQNNAFTQNLASSGYATIYPYAQLADADGNHLSLPQGVSTSYAENAMQNGYLDWKFRPLDELQYADNTSKTRDNRILAGLKYSFLHGFNADLKYQYERSDNTGNNYYSQQTYYTRNLINRYSINNGNGTFTYPIPLGGILLTNNSGLTSNRGRLQLSYEGQIAADHQLSAIAGAEISDVVTNGNSSTAYGYNKDSQTSSNAIDFKNTYDVLPNGAGQIPNSLGFAKYTDRYISYFGNAGYTYKGRYLLSVSGRIDKSNLFGVNTNQKSVPLYSAGLGWNLSKEPFYPLSGVLPYSKLRVTYGYNGNIDKNVTAVTTIRQNSNSWYSGIPYAFVANTGNPELRWERVRMVNFGLDFSSKNDVISGSIEYYLKKGLDLIGDAPWPNSTGVSTFRGNNANTAGHGFDIALNSININTGKFGWKTNFILSYVTDKVTKYDVTAGNIYYLDLGDGNAGSDYYPMVGKPVFAVYSYKWAGLAHDTGEPQGYLNGVPSTDYTAIIAQTKADDLVYNGTSRPITFGSLRNTFTYGPLSLSMNVIFKLNYYFRRSSISYEGLYGAWMGHQDYYSRWQKPGDELISDVPSMQYPPVNSNRESFYTLSSALVSKGDHIRLQDITLNYDIGKVGSAASPVTLHAYCYVNNVGILWRANKYGLDPDIYSTSGDTTLPLPRTYAIGIKANF